MRLVLRGEQAQVEFGQRLSAALGPRALVFLNGDLGTGKTTLVRGFMQARGHRGAVKSPTYTLIEPYELPGGVCYHLDLYRLGDPEELEFLGLREMLQEQAVLLVEWPQRGQGWLPEPDLVVHLDYLGEGTARELALQAGSPMGENVISMISG